MTEEQLIARDLRRMDRETLPHRVARLAELNRRTTQDGMLFAGGEVVFYAYHDAQFAFLHGQWIATILTAQVAIRRHLSALLHIRQIDPPPAPAKLIEAAQTIGLDAETAASLTELFKIARWYTDYQDPPIELQRLVAKGYDIQTMVETEARQVMHIMLDYFTKYCVI